jgi:uncharacterized CHY-type Zn-finger protein
MQQKNITVKGKILDEQTRCVHYHSPLDIIAVKMNCCGIYYSCIYCHNEEAGHAAVVWPETEFTNKAILCGNCKQELTISQYLQSNNSCPGCKASFNPRCSNHYHFYFEQ